MTNEKDQQVEFEKVEKATENFASWTPREIWDAGYQYASQELAKEMPDYYGANKRLAGINAQLESQLASLKRQNEKLRRVIREYLGPDICGPNDTWKLRFLEALQDVEK